MFSRAELDAAQRLVHAVMPPTPAYAWPLLERRYGLTVVVKHENHTPIGAFKVRGGIVYLDRLKRERPAVRGIVSATRGNHGQSLAFAAGHAGLPLAIVVPHGNSVEKNAAMRAFGAELIEHGRDFDEARERAAEIAAERGYEFVPSFHRDLVLGVATYALELFTAHPDIDVLYAPVGLGSGICGLIAARDLLGLRTRIVGVVPKNADAYALSFAAGEVVPVNRLATFADGTAVRIPSAEALAIIRAGAERIVTVTEDAIAEAIRVYWSDTHNAAEGAGAVALAALAGEAARLAGAKAAVILSGQNIDRPLMHAVLGGATPAPG
ncbi:threonine dehydratase [Phreatobacter sp. AB_2022a]|uniref:threonine dehydratase n=1 Tax=Phreatobacter sp. AB_2022a TaxID=3003134 RepID=UPI0022871626|nr:threonine dehydratase [Phreatobacter sp. AB_2022a]MCZ0736855.1 threonine dehydratase [Phreatobacter sp. AB_2022a]